MVSAAACVRDFWRVTTEKDLARVKAAVERKAKPVA
jgi:hypothetical protein